MTTIWRCSERPAQERDRLQRQLAASGELVDQPAGVGVRRAVGEGDDGVVDGRHPRVELLVEARRAGTRRRPARPARAGGRWRGARSALCSTTCSSPAATASSVLPVPARPSSATTSIAGVEQQLEGEALLLRPGPQPPRFGRGVGEQLEAPPTRSGQRRLRAGAQDGELVLAEPTSAPSTAATSTAPRGVQPVDDLGAGLDRRPPGGLRRRRRHGRPVLGGGDAEVGRLDAQRGVVGHASSSAPRSAWPRAAPMIRLSELAGSRPCSTSRCLRTPLISICRLPVAERHRLGQRAAVADAQVLDRAQRGAGRPADVVGPASSARRAPRRRSAG